MNVIEIHPGAKSELREGADWYEQRSPGLGRDLLDEAARAVESIRQRPTRWPVHRAGTRKRLLHRFPYAVIYRIEDERILIAAFAHLRRRPAYWADRLQR